jgi:protoporphyrinogen oxidase
MTGKTIIIIGAGPTSLGAAYRLKELGHDNFQMYERSDHIGGLASSFTDSAGFTWDIGGHVMFSHYKYYDDVFSKLMGDDYQQNMRECWVRMFDTWVPYPFQNNIRYLPKEVTYECLSGLVDAQTRREHSQTTNFAEFMDAVFGAGIVKHFMKPYNFKVWAHPAEMMNKEWIGERVAMIDINRAIKNVVMGTDDFGWGPNNQFKFPLFGGTGEFYRRFAKPLAGHVNLNKGVDFINLSKKEVRFTDGQIQKFDHLISAMPLDKLCNDVINGEMPREIKKATASLRHSGGYMVGIGIKQPCPSTKSWMYFPEDNCPFYRVTYLSNYSPFMTPNKDRYYSLLCEISYSEFKPVDGRTVIQDTIRGLINAGLIAEEDQEDIVDTWILDAKYSYPTPSVERDGILSTAIPYLEQHGVYSRGRFGMWKYEVSNTDHSLMQGVELANRLLLDEPETTIGMKYASTTDGRNAATHERATVAGSGEKRKTPSVLHPGALVRPTDEFRAPEKQTAHAPNPGDIAESHISEEELGIVSKDGDE